MFGTAEIISGALGSTSLKPRDSNATRDCILEVCIYIYRDYCIYLFPFNAFQARSLSRTARRLASPISLTRPFNAHKRKRIRNNLELQNSLVLRTNEPSVKRWKKVATQSYTIRRIALCFASRDKGESKSGII